MAAIERGLEAPDSEVRAWLAKAVKAPRGPQWVCDNCGAFDTLSWTEPKEGDMRMPGGEKMDALLIGAPDIAPDAEMVVEAEHMEPEDAETPTDTPADVVDVTPEDTTETETKN
jgi:HemY protein